MLTGRQPGVINGGDFARQRSQMQASGGVQGMQDLAARELQSMQRGQRRPMATADVRGSFGTPVAAQHDLGNLHELLLQLMQGGRRPAAPMLGPPAGAVGPRY